MTLEVDVRLQLGTLDLDVQFTVEPGELIAILGPNGAGKSTVLRCVAGLLPIEAGSIRIDGEVVDDPGADIFVAAERRSTGVVFQDYLLFANMTAVENVAFGLRARGVDRRAARAVAADWLSRVGMDSHAGHRPRALSGGQAQRVALARALATDPRVLLLDEPLAALDVGARSTVRRDLRRHLESFEGMRLMVTHDPVDAYALADRVVVLEAGHVMQQGTLAEVTAHPRSRYIAELVGLNLIGGTATGTTLTTPSGACVVTADRPGDGPAYVAIRPQAVSLHRHQPEGSARNVWLLTVDDIDQLHDRARVALTGTLPIVAEITPAALIELDVRPGEQIWASVKATDIVAYAA
ncbi:MAG: ABC transporter ATP-binding protein [Ilumatobacteraceae bacterium]